MNSLAGMDLPKALDSTHFDWLGRCHTGKVRDSYTRGSERILVATDRLSAFDRVLTTVPLKGQVLTQMARYWFDRVAGITSHHVLAIPDPCVMIAREVSIIPVEIVVRGYLAGSAWRDYQSGLPVSGVTLPAGLRQFEALATPIITPSTKEGLGKHDMPISESDIVKSGLVDARVWEQVRSRALSLFCLASAELSERGLIFVDTKYEFGILDGEVVLADEIHTLDSSRFWVARSYEAALERGEVPEMLDKEPVRRWLMDRGFKGDGDAPPIGDEYRGELMRHYVRSFELITGNSFVANLESPARRIERNLRGYYGMTEASS